MENIHLNHLAIIVAALSNFLLGGLWYSPILFYKAWMRENNFTEEHLKKEIQRLFMASPWCLH